ncbi:copper resistance protein CopB, partial [Acinetobacter junii]|uniref:copper resistance protein B n=1 Tax=Acinetobacter junii TaxID=40215 RepID=UPI000DFB142D
MHTTKKLYSKTLVSLALLGLTSVAFANDPSTGNLVNSSQSESMRVLLKEPGGLGYAERNTYQKTTSGNDGDNSTGFETVIPNGQNHDKHLKEHGGQIYQVTRLENAWIVDEDGKGNLGTKFDTLIGTDENRLFIEANSEKSESSDINYDISALYSRNVAPFWDVQAGVRYSEDKKEVDQEI